MSRKVQEITITEDNRDKGKTFVITEMPAKRAEKWGAKALTALIRAGIDIGPISAGSGMAGIAAAGASQLANLTFDDLEPLMDEMFQCVKIKMPAMPEGRPLIDNGSEGDDIEEVSTRLRLRQEVLELHLGFSIPAAKSTSA